MEQLWGSEGTPIFCADGTNSWHSFKFLDGLFQGHNLSSLLFTLGLRRALRRFYELCDDSVKKMIHLEYIDDLILHFDPNNTKLIVLILEQALASVHLRLNHSKSKNLILSASIGDVHPVIAELGLPQVLGSLEFFGGAMEGEASMEVPAPVSFDVLHIVPGIIFHYCGLSRY